MNDAPSEILLQALIDVGLVSLPSDGLVWPCFIGSKADVPSQLDNVLALYDEAPNKDGRLMASGDVILHHVVRIRLRSNEYSVGWNKLDTIARALDYLLNTDVTVGTNSYVLNNASLKTGVDALGLEAGTQRRFMFELKYALTLTAM